MDPEVIIECPICGHEESSGFAPTISISFDAEIDITEVDCGECGYVGPPWPFDDKCPQCGGTVSGELLEMVDGRPVKARLFCNGERHIDDGTSCGHEWDWVA